MYIYTYIYICVLCMYVIRPSAFHQNGSASVRYYNYSNAIRNGNVQMYTLRWYMRVYESLNSSWKKISGHVDRKQTRDFGLRWSKKKNGYWRLYRLIRTPLGTKCVRSPRRRNGRIILNKRETADSLRIRHGYRTIRYRDAVCRVFWPRNILFSRTLIAPAP